MKMRISVSSEVFGWPLRKLASLVQLSAFLVITAGKI